MLELQELEKLALETDVDHTVVTVGKNPFLHPLNLYRIVDVDLLAVPAGRWQEGRLAIVSKGEVLAATHQCGVMRSAGKAQLDKELTGKALPDVVDGRDLDHFDTGDAQLPRLEFFMRDDGFSHRL
eukprot:1812342-Prymnesium_polylepis.1